MSEAWPQVEIVILSRNREPFCREAVASAVAQKYPNLKVTLSDNSTNSSVADIVRTQFPSVRIIRRIPQLTAIEHANAILSEANTDFLVMFHDDDTLGRNYTLEMVNLLERYPHAAAVACNAFTILGNKFTNRKIMGSYRHTQKIHEKATLLAKYLKFDTAFPAPLPGYMYRVNTLQCLRFNYSNGGKHCDVSFLCELLERGPIIWTDKCLFNYRQHLGSDSSDEEISARQSLMKYSRDSLGIDRRHHLFTDYKFKYLRKWLKSADANKAKEKRIKTIRRFVLLKMIRLSVTRKAFWHSFFIKLYSIFANKVN